MYNSTIIYGDKLISNPFISAGESSDVKIPGKYANTPKKLGLDEDLLSKHLLLLGGTGCGKTNVMYYIIEQIKSKMTPDDVMIVFDTKGDFFDRFYTPKDVVISNSKEYEQITVKWNILREAAADGWNDGDLIINSQEIAYSLFSDAIEKSHNPFFPQAARDVFASILIQFLRYASSTDAMGVDISPRLFLKKFANNMSLKGFLDELSVESLHSFIESKDLQSIFTYVGDGDNSQGLGVLSELQYIARQVLVGSFAQKGSFSIRDFVRSRGGRTLFVEYDLSLGSSLAPIYRLLFDLAFKEAMGRTRAKLRADGVLEKKQSRGNVYFIFDEFKLLPNLKHIEDGVNFGRSLGVKVIAGLQSIRQLQEAYGEARANNIIAGFSSVFAFRMNDTVSHEYISKLYGDNYVIEHFLTSNGKIEEKERVGHTVENWDLGKLDTGDAIIGLCSKRPYLFHFDQYIK